MTQHYYRGLATFLLLCMIPADAFQSSSLSLSIRTTTTTTTTNHHHHHHGALLAASKDNNGQQETAVTGPPRIRMVPCKLTVNRATLDFNKRLNVMSRAFDTQTAQHVQSTLEHEMKNYKAAIAAKAKAAAAAAAETTTPTTDDDDDDDELCEAPDENDTLIRPNVVSWTAVINAWARCTQRDMKGRRAQAIFDEMVELYDNGIDSGGDGSGDFEQLKPNLFAFHAVITAWVRSNEQGASSKALALLEQLSARYNATGDETLKPDARAFNLVINAIARSREPDCADRAASLLHQMEELYVEGDLEMQPDASTFGSIINAYANSGQDGSSDKAIQILQQMESLYQLGYKTVKPNTFVYNSCINAFAKSTLVREAPANAQKAQELLNWMERQYREHNDATVKPDVISYATCINAHANSREADAGQKAGALLEKMIDLYIMGDKDVKPNAVAYTAVLKAYLNSIANTTEGEQQRQGRLQDAAKKCLDMVVQMCLLYRNGDRKVKPTKITFDLATEILDKAGDADGKARIEMLRQGI
eukprot:CAMPEP_0119009086 /NCGR_PEP_ID=MMETSP1176-20130426/4132_1 /TAXON_ID=265551 /ORGANISM="Synedropsis recta cf, Strain CCMP1620" /LENGTH=532 /DNA_ID=CAMNT_0006961535 /DNA_START=50 /DNA_END=1648 /DNA_ORIENTATION=+